ncbi:MAG: Yip1 family protein [Bacillota bacterium]
MVLLGQSPIYAAFLVSFTGLLHPDKTAKPSVYWTLGIILLAPLLVLFAWGFNAFLLHLLARLCGSTAEFKTTLLLYGCATAPYLFVFPLLLFPQALWGQFLFLFANGWSIFLLYLGFLMGHGLSRGRTFLVVLVGQFLLPLLLALLAL